MSKMLGLVAVLLAACAVATGTAGAAPEAAQAARGTLVFAFHPLWSTCQGEAPAVARFARLHPRITVIAVASRYARPADLTRFAQRYLRGSSVRLVRDPTGQIARSYGMEYYPHFLALDRKGRRLGESYSFAEALAQARFDAAARTWAGPAGPTVGTFAHSWVAPRGRGYTTQPRRGSRVAKGGGL
jgi:hypothetical protein